MRRIDHYVLFINYCINQHGIIRLELFTFRDRRDSFTWRGQDTKDMAISATNTMNGCMNTELV